MEHTVDHQKMEALKALADTTLKVSEVKAMLTSLEETETQYLIDREKKAVKKVSQILEESKEFLTEAFNNYKEVQDLYQTVSSFADYLSTARTSFEVVLHGFYDKSDKWDVEVERQRNEVAETRKSIKVAQTKIENDRLNIESQIKDTQEKIRILSDREGVVDRDTKRIVTRELEIHTNLELIKSKEKHLEERKNALTAKEAQLNNREKSIKDNEERQSERERAITDKYATLQKTLKQISE